MKRRIQPKTKEKKQKKKKKKVEKEEKKREPSKFYELEDPHLANFTLCLDNEKKIKTTRETVFVTFPNLQNIFRQDVTGTKLRISGYSEEVVRVALRISSQRHTQSYKCEDFLAEICHDRTLIPPLWDLGLRYENKDILDQMNEWIQGFLGIQNTNPEIMNIMQLVIDLYEIAVKLNQKEEEEYLLDFIVARKGKYAELFLTNKFILPHGLWEKIESNTETKEEIKIQDIHWFKDFSLFIRFLQKIQMESYENNSIKYASPFLTKSCFQLRFNELRPNLSIRKFISETLMNQTEQWKKANLKYVLLLPYNSEWPQVFCHTSW